MGCRGEVDCRHGAYEVVASEFPFRRLIGVELAPVLARIAQANVECLRRRFPDRPPIRVVEENAATIQLPDGQVVVYFYHPFFRGLMKKVLANLAAAVTSGRIGKMFVIYCNPVYADLFDASPVFHRYFADNLDYDAEEMGTGPSFHDRNDAVAIWQSRGVPMAPSRLGTTAKIEIVPPGWRAQVVH